MRKGNMLDPGTLTHIANTLEGRLTAEVKEHLRDAANTIYALNVENDRLRAEAAKLKAEAAKLRQDNTRLANTYHIVRDEAAQFKAQLRRLLLDVLEC